MTVYLIHERRRRRSIPIQYPDNDSYPTKYSSAPPRPSRSGIPALFSSRPSPPHPSPTAPLWPREKSDWSTVSQVAAVSLERRPTSPSVYSRISDKNPWDTLAEPGLAKLAHDNSPMSRHASLTSLDIEDILNSATIYNFKENDGVSDLASDVSPTSHPSIDQAFVLVNPPPRRYTAGGQKLDRWDKRPDVPTDSPIRFSQATDLDAIVPQHPPGLLNTHTRSSSLPQTMSRSRPMLYPQRLSTVVATPAPSVRMLSTAGTPTSSPGLSAWVGKEPKTATSVGSGWTYQDNRSSQPLGGVIRSAWYAI